MKTSVFAVAATLMSTVLADVPAIEIKGSKFFYSNNGTQFYMRGVAYQRDVSTNTTAEPGQTYSDPLADVDGCRRDIPFLEELRTNTIRVYAIDPDNNHDDCMGMLADAGIYVIADLSQPSVSINRDDPSWTEDLYERYTSVIDSLIKYNNTLGFFAGNEVSNKINNTEASAYVKAAVRDSKAYIKSQNYRSIGVGYATNDDKDIVDDMANYFNCGDDEADRIDFWGYNIYSWCGSDATFASSLYEEHTQKFAEYSVPVFFAEYGCNEVQPREFTDVSTLYGDEMNGVWSGGIVYMYFQEANDYGLVSIDGNEVKTLDDFNNYKSQIATINPTGVNSNSYTPTNTSPASCPSVDASWGAVATPLPEQANPQLCECMMESLTCTIKSDVELEAYEDIFDFVCGTSDDACAGIVHNATTGDFGAYSVCNATQQLSFVINLYASGQSGNSNACDFDGQASTKTARDQSDTCRSLLGQAGSAGTGDVTDAPAAATGVSGNDDDEGAASGLVIPNMQFGLFQLGGYVLFAGLSGAAMIFL